MTQPISEYNRKRNFNKTSEPPEEKSRGRRAVQGLRFVIQKHDARNLHYDFRLELNGTLKSWAVPKGPSLDPKDKRLAVHVEDHPISYAKFEGSIPQGQYGGGDVIVWDHGIWQPHDDVNTAYKSGKLKFTLIGEKLTGDWTLVRANFRGKSDKEQWLLIKEKDEMARPAEEYDIVVDRPESVITGGLLPRDVANPGKSPYKNKGAPNVNLVTKELPETAVPLIRSAKKKIDPTTPSVKKTPKPKTELVLPPSFSPELATLVSEPPEGDWLYEIKFDGYRMLARVLGGKVNIFTRNNNDWTNRLPLLVKAIESLNLADSWLDGEIVVLNEQGLPGFQALQNALDAEHTQDIIYFLFDAPFLNGIDLRTMAVEIRRAELEKILPRRKSVLRYSAAFTADHHNIIESACSMSLEGVIGKRAGSPYVSRRSNDWIKLKCRLRQEFVIVGYTEPQGSRNGFGAILLGVHKDVKNSELLYAGRVGTGFDEKRLSDIYKKMHSLEQDSSPISTKLTGVQKRGVHWVKPTLVCEVEFAEWTGDGILRQAAFIALRTDKPAKDIVRERPRSAGKQKEQGQGSEIGGAKVVAKKTSSSVVSKSGKVDVAGVGISHPDRVLDVESGGTKLNLAQFYEAISEFILPHLTHRPVSLLRAPDGISGEQFFQKHSENRAIPHVIQLDPKLDPTHAPLMEIDSDKALIGCVQMNTIELHTWGSTSKAIEMPDRFVLDLDPDPALPWRSVIEATRLTLAVLDELKLDSFLKTTGGKGMHIIVPLTPDADWDTVKAFSKAIAQFMATQIPERFVAKMGPKNRIGRIFVDYLRNTRGASTVSAYSVRARPGLPVSVPISRDELDKISHSDQWNIGNLYERLEKIQTNSWSNYSGENYKKSQKITKTMWKKLGVNSQ